MRRRPEHADVYVQLGVAVRALELVTEALVTEQERRRVDAENALSVAQTRRSEARIAWMGLMFAQLADIFPEQTLAFAAAQGALREVADRLAEAERNADLALVSRVTEIVSNEQIARAEADDALRATLEGRDA